jgi:hypothetical protein
MEQTIQLRKEGVVFLSSKLLLCMREWLHIGMLPV